MTSTAARVPRWGMALLLGLLALALYLPSLRYGFVFDDVTYITANKDVQAGLTRDALRWAFTTTTGGHRHPVTWLSHLVDVEFYGLKPAGHHFTNVLLHALNTALLFLLLDALTGRRGRSAVVAALFAVHPLHVETVAWVADRKDLLAAFFSLLAIAAYLRYARRGSITAYVASLAAFVLAILSKAMAVTLPVLLLLLDAWPLGRRWRIAEKIPYVLMAGGAAALAGPAAESAGEGLTPSPWPLGVQSANALVQYATYVLKTIWPSRLAVLYPLQEHPSWPRVALAGVALVVITALVVRAWRRAPYLAFGWAWFLVALAPVIGLVPGGPMTLGDRYMYLPIVGLFVAAVWGVGDLGEAGPPSDAVPGASRRHGTRRASSTARQRIAAAGPALALVATVVFAGLSLAQSRTWRDSESLFGRALQVNRRNPLTCHNMAVLKARAGRMDEAIALDREAIATDPRFVGGYHNLGAHLAAQGKYQEAIPPYQTALRLRPRSPQTLYDLGGALTRLGRTDEAIAAYEAALAISPDMGPAHNNLGVVFLKLGRLDEAIRHFEEARRLQPTSALAWENLQDAIKRRDAMHRDAARPDAATPGGSSAPR
jgi:protein O-mannosyl-transferase